MSKTDSDSVFKFIAGGSAGILAKSLVAPIDRVKFLFMGTVRHFNLKSLYKELFRIHNEEGLRSFWKGNLAQLLRVFPYSGIVIPNQQFSVYDRVEKLLANHLNDSSAKKALKKFISGSAAGTAAVLVTYPFDVMRTRLAYQTTGQVYKGIFHGFYTIFANEGPQTLFRGIVPTVTGVSLYGGTTFCIFFSLKQWAPDASKTEIFCYGSFAGLAGQIVAYPFDVVRKRMLAHGFIEKVSNWKATEGGQKMEGTWSYFRMIWKHEGVKGLLKGITLNFVKAPVMLGTVHLINHLINKSADRDY
jgi:hypothetical protein